MPPNEQQATPVLPCTEPLATPGEASIVVVPRERPNHTRRINRFAYHRCPIRSLWYPLPLKGTS